MARIHVWITGLLVCMAITCNIAFTQQYPGGMGSGGAGGTGSTGTSTPSYGSKGAAIGGAVGGAAAGAGLLYWYRHTHATLVGCVGDDGTTLLNEKDNHSYALVNNGSTLKPGQRVELKGKKV